MSKRRRSKVDDGESASLADEPRRSARLVGTDISQLIEEIDPEARDRAQLHIDQMQHWFEMEAAMHHVDTLGTSTVCTAGTTKYTSEITYRPEFEPSRALRPAESFVDRLVQYSALVSADHVLTTDETLVYSPSVVDRHGVLINATEYDHNRSLKPNRPPVEALHRTVLSHLGTFIDKKFPEYDLVSQPIDLSAVIQLCNKYSVPCADLPTVLMLNSPRAALLSWLSSHEEAIRLRTADTDFVYAADCASDTGFSTTLLSQGNSSNHQVHDVLWRGLGGKHVASGLSQTQRTWLGRHTEANVHPELVSRLAQLDRQLGGFTDGLVHAAQTIACTLKYGSRAAPLGIALHIDGVAVTSYGRSEVPVYISHVHGTQHKHSMYLLGFFIRYTPTWPENLSKAKRKQVLQAFWAAQLQSIMQCLQSVLGTPFQISANNSLPNHPDLVVPYLAFVASDMVERWKLSAVKHNWCVRCTVNLSAQTAAINRNDLCHCCCVTDKSAARLGYADRPPSVLQMLGYPYSVYACDIMHEFHLGIVQKFMLYTLAMARVQPGVSEQRALDVWCSALHTVPSFRRNTISLIRAGNGTIMRAYEYGLMAPVLPLLIDCAMAPLLGPHAAAVSAVASMVAHVHLQLQNTLVYDAAELLKLQENISAMCDGYRACFHGIKLSKTAAKRDTVAVSAAVQSASTRSTFSSSTIGSRRSARQPALAAASPAPLPEPAAADDSDDDEWESSAVVNFPKLHSVHAHLVLDIVLFGPPSFTSTASLERAHSTLALPQWHRSSKRGNISAELARHARITQWYNSVMRHRSFILPYIVSDQLQACISHAANLALHHLQYLCQLGRSDGTTSRITAAARAERALVSLQSAVYSAYKIAESALMPGYVPTEDLTAAKAAIKLFITRIARNWMRRATLPSATEIEAELDKLPAAVDKARRWRSTRRVQYHGAWTCDTAHDLGFSVQTTWFSRPTAATLRDKCTTLLQKAFVKQLGKGCSWRRCTWIKSQYGVTVQAAPTYHADSHQPRDKIDHICWVMTAKRLQLYLTLAVYFGHSQPDKDSKQSDACAGVVLCARLHRRGELYSLQEFDGTYNATDLLARVQVFDSTKILCSTSLLVLNKQPDGGYQIDAEAIACIRDVDGTRMLAVQDPPGHFQAIPAAAQHRSTMLTADVWAATREKVEEQLQPLATVLASDTEQVS